MNLDVAFCPGCGKMYTRNDIAAYLRENRHSVFKCACEYEWNGSMFRPYTLREIFDGKTSTTYHDVELERYTRAVLEYVLGQGMRDET